MALINLIKGATFFGDIIDYDWEREIFGGGGWKRYR